MLVVSLGVHAQVKKWEHNVYVGAGLMIDDHGYRTKKGLAFNAGYGLNYYFNEQWSLMPGVAVRQVSENGFADSADGADDDVFTFLDVPVVAQYHVGTGKGAWTLGLGPVFSFCVGNDTYYMDAAPGAKLNDLDKCKTFSFGLQPSVSYRLGKHFGIGLDGYISLSNMKNNHGLLSGSKHIHCIVAKAVVMF